MSNSLNYDNASHNSNNVIYMMPPDRFDAKVNVKDLLLFVIKKIFVMIIAGVILGGALFSYKFMQRAKTYDVLDVGKRLSENESDIQYQLRVQNIEKARNITDVISKVNSQIESERKYIANSIYMQIDPENEYQATAQIVLTLENNDTSGLDSTLFFAYENDILSGDYFESYANKIGTKTDYLMELVTFTYSSPNTTILNSDKDLDRTGFMYISVIGPSQELVDDLIDIVIDELFIVNKNLNSSVVNHNISVIEVQHIKKMDSFLRDNQVNHANRIQTLQNQISNCNDNLDKIAMQLGLSDKEAILSYFSEHEEEIIDIDNSGIPTETSERSVSRSSMIKPSLKWGIFGFAGGFCIVVVIFVLAYLFSRRLVSQGQFFSTFPGIKKIGVLKPVYKRSKYTEFIDSISDDDNHLSFENNNKLVSANYKNITNSYEKVLVTGTGDKSMLSDVYKSLELKGDFKPNIFESPEYLKNVPDYDAVVLIEQRKVSSLKNISNEIDYLSNSGTPIIGAIIL